MLCNQFRHTTSQDLKVLYTEYIDILNTLYKKKSSCCPFLASDDGSRTRSLRVVKFISQGYITIAGVYNPCDIN